MTVHPGFGGQSFIAEAAPKLAEARADAEREGLRVTLQVDGRIDERTATVAALAGARCFVAGSAVFHAPDPAQAVRGIHAAASAVIAASR